MLTNYTFIFFIIFFFIFFRCFRYFFTSFICIRIIDSKVIVAFSSVSHISIAFVRTITRVFIGLKRRYLIYLRHGIVSPCIFYIIFILNKIFSTRHLVRIRNIIKINKFLFIIFFFLILFNISLPPTINFFSEVFIIISIFF